MKFRLTDTNDFRNVKHFLFIKTINTEREKDVLAVCPHERKLNLAFVPYILVANEPSFMVARVTYDMVRLWDMSETEIINLAKINTPKLFPSTIYGLNDIVQSFYNGEEAMETVNFNGPTVITNNSKFCGATALFYPGILEMIHKGMGNFYALPSSVHEWILMPDNNSFNVDAKYLSHMVRDINENEVAATDRLSDYVYYYDGNNFTIVA